MPSNRIPFVPLALALSCLAAAFGQDDHPTRSAPIKNPFSPNGRYQLVLVHSLWPSGDADSDSENWYSACLLDRNVGANRGGAQVIANVDQTPNQPAFDNLYATWSADSQRLAFAGTAKRGGDYLEVFSISGHIAHEQKLPDYWDAPEIDKLLRKLPGFAKGIESPGQDNLITFGDLQWQNDHTLTATIEYDFSQTESNASATLNVEGRFEKGKTAWKFVVTKISQAAQ